MSIQRFDLLRSWLAEDCPALDKSLLVPMVAEIGTALLLAVGEDPQREGLQETPHRWARWWQEFTNYNPGNTDTTFESIEADQMIVVKGIKVWSLCEHHLLPFWCEIAIGYISKERVLGLSKFARIAQKHSHRLQIQEALVRDIAIDVSSLALTDDVAVLAAGEHLCMQMRGIRSEGVLISSYMGGSFRSEQAVRAEFLSLIKK